MTPKDDILTLACNQIYSDEGYVDHVYLDTEGYPTGGIGFKMSDLTTIELQVLGPEPYTYQACMNVLGMKLSKVYDQVASQLDFFTSLSDNRQVALLDLAYQVGIEGLMGFHKMLNAMRLSDWQTACNECANSEEAIVSPKRNEVIRNLILVG